MARSRSWWSIIISTVVAMVFSAASAGAQEVVVYSEGFEANNGGFNVLALPNSANWQWGTPPLTPGPGGCHSGVRCWGTNFGGQLPRPSDSSIVSPMISLPPVSGNQVIRVRFWAFVSIDGMRDRGEFFVSKDGASWQSLMQMYNTMATAATSAPMWQPYEFGLDPSYANGPIFLRFRAAVSNSSPSFYCGGSGDLSGVYIDDLKISRYDFAGPRKLLNLEAWEDPNEWASCPWVAPWNGSEFAADNDIYSVARGFSSEYTDAYRLTKPLVASNGVYAIEIQERDNEKSYTDYAALTEIDHTPEVAVAPDEQGRLHGYKPAALLAALSATAGEGDVTALLKAIDDDGVAAYGGDTVIVNFGMPDISRGAVLVLRAAGFIVGTGDPQPYNGPPAVVVETRATTGDWLERGRLRPRFNFSVAAFDLAPFLTPGQPVMVRLRSVSHELKYNSIDWVALYPDVQPPFTTTTVPPIRATFGARDVLGLVTSADGSYVETSPGEKFSMDFPAPPLAPGTIREFVFVSKGYYTPLSGTYLVYTQENGQWVMRDGYSFPGSDFLKSFDLSLFLPDASGQFKARIWQDYQYEYAGVDYVGMTVGGAPAPLNSAIDRKKGTNVLAQLQNADDVRDEFSTACPRDRVIEVAFTPPGPINLPPSTNPVTATNTATPTIAWTYADGDGDPQAEAEVQVWTAPGGNGTILWNPSPFGGTWTSVAYAGGALAAGTTYYARVRAYDGKDWGPWSEGSFTVAVPICGDLNADGTVNTLDYGIIRAAYGARSGQAQYNASADLDKDGVVSLKDYSAWYACYVKYR